MIAFVARRAMGMVVSILLVVTITFLLMKLIPGDPAAVLLGPNATPEQIESLRRTWGLDQPLVVQFFKYFSNFFRGDFGQSIFLQEPVMAILGRRAETSVFLGVMALAVVVGLGVPAGILAAIRPNSWVDNSLLLVALAGASIPSFWLGLMLMVVFAGKLHLLPSSGFTSVLATGNLANLKSLILPAFSLGFVNAALVARTARSSMLDVLQADYITTAKAKGLGQGRVIVRHALRNAAIPITTVVSFTFAALVSGAVVTENVFALPGIGSLIVQSVLKRDYPVIQGIMLIVAVLYVFLNFVTDLTYASLDPRIRYR
ncbi:MAG: ABC transporter permease [Candidatus Bipolaricaulaceae bacterium]